ncbi:MAG: hypothetical protein MJ002_02210 [Paludibacteraceae bacterium]|nr:hypothetical protein [Paludibacteraceae bacterium]
MFEEYKKQGFDGFKTIAELKRNDTCIPKQGGVYLVLRGTLEAPKFLETGTGGFFKDENPNVPLDELQRNWVEGADIVYIGKAGSKDGSATLQSRLRQLISFGCGNKVGHRGGRYLWQLEDSNDLIVCWLSLIDKEPRDVEKELIQSFKIQHSGMRPFANLQD